MFLTRKQEPSFISSSVFLKEKANSHPSGLGWLNLLAFCLI